MRPIVVSRLAIATPRRIRLLEANVPPVKSCHPSTTSSATFYSLVRTSKSFSFSVAVRGRLGNVQADVDTDMDMRIADV